MKKHVFFIIFIVVPVLWCRPNNKKYTCNDVIHQRNGI